MSRSRHRRQLTVEQEPYLSIRSLATGCTNGYMIEAHRHEWHQLVYATAGAMTVSSELSSWMIPPGKAVFIPAGFTHSIRMWGEVDTRFLYFAPTLTGGECHVLSVTPLLRELVVRVTELGALDSRHPGDQRLAGLLLDEMKSAPVSPLMLPMPSTPGARAVARHVLAAPTCGETLDDLSARYGAGRRTLERVFRKETGLSFGLWRQKVRLLDGIRLLAEGKSVTDAALDTGYSSVSAFIAAFKQTFGCTPGRF